MASGGGGGTVGNATSTYAGGTGGIGITADANGGVSLVKALLSRTVQCMSCHVLLSSCMQACHDGITRCMVCRMVGMVAVAVVATAATLSVVRDKESFLGSHIMPWWYDGGIFLTGRVIGPRGCFRVHGCVVLGGGGGAGYNGGAGGNHSINGRVTPSTALAGSSFLDAYVNGTCTGLPGNFGDGFVIVAMQ